MWKVWAQSQCSQRNPWHFPGSFPNGITTITTLCLTPQLTTYTTNSTSQWEPMKWRCIPIKTWTPTKRCPQAWESPTDPRIMDKYILNKLEEMSKQLLALLEMPIPKCSLDRESNTSPHLGRYYSEDHPEDWLILDSLEIKCGGVATGRTVFEKLKNVPSLETEED